MNTDGAANDSTGPTGCGGVFRNYGGFFHGCFVILFLLVRFFAFKAELLLVIHAISFAWDKGWHSLWLESYFLYMSTYCLLQVITFLGDGSLSGPII